MSRLIVLALALAATLFAERPYTDVPYVPTSAKVVDAMLDLAGITPADVLVDLGSGDGRIVIAAARRFGIRATGVEIDPELVRQSQQSARQEGVQDKTEFVSADLFGYDLRRATVVTVFLTPGVNLRLRPKLLRELRPGTRIVSHRFDMGSWTPAKTVEVDGDRLYLWTVPKPGEARSEKAAIPPAAVPFAKLASMFSYDPTAPLNARTEDPAPADGASVTAISFAGARGPVSATLVIPRRKGKHPAIVFVHDYGRRDEFLPEALLLARANPPAVSLLIDAPPERPAGWRRSFNAMVGTESDRDIHIQAVVDIRRGIDLLAARGDIDAGRIAYVGHGYGANWGVILASIETRLRGFVLVAAIPGLAELMQSDDPDWADTRHALGAAHFAAYQNAMSTVDPIRFAPAAGDAPILCQFGRFDSFVSRPMADQLLKSFPRPPAAEYYEAGHSVNDPRAVTARSSFLARCFHRR